MLVIPGWGICVSICSRHPCVMGHIISTETNSSLISSRKLIYVCTCSILCSASSRARLYRQDTLVDSCRRGSLRPDVSKSAQWRYIWSKEGHYRLNRTDSLLPSWITLLIFSENDCKLIWTFFRINILAHNSTKNTIYFCITNFIIKKCEAISKLERSPLIKVYLPLQPSVHLHFEQSVYQDSGGPLYQGKEQSSLISPK